jgi:hypothetical protein
VSFAGEPFEQDHVPVETPDNFESLFQQIFAKHKRAKLKPRALQALILIAFRHSSHSFDYQFILQKPFCILTLLTPSPRIKEGGRPAHRDGTMRAGRPRSLRDAEATEITDQVIPPTEFNLKSSA